MAIYKGDQTPYAQAQKEKAPESAATLIMSGAEMNRTVEDYIVIAVNLQAITRVIGKVADAYYMEDKVKIRFIEDILEGEDNVNA